jgi:hypothetical protein
MTPKDSLAAGPRVVRIAYHRRMYGLGEVSPRDEKRGTKNGMLICSTTTRYVPLLPKSVLDSRHV